ncbi:hypothetical protein Pcinc_007721 [Petrolisthes cinctipes]|uniref:DDE-1 domain-containing protein n=1 Tax=Petrolisthes cinctipes TaxID=88211 RepID=A0AAE1L070_PETCI|nr:hypothetical protein Pcinc_007721 [Petrolisthes cinctipes]
MVVVDEEDRNVGQLTLQNLKSYNLRSVIYNISRAWNDVSSSTLANGWNRLLHRTEPVVDFEGFAADDFHRQFVEAGENTTVDDINDWLECDEGDPGQQVLTEEQIAAEVLNPDEGNDSEDDDDDSLPSRPTTSEARKAADVLLDYFEHPISSTHMQSYGPMLREVRDALIKAQSQWSKKQTKIETFFKPTTPSPHPTPSPNLEMEPSQSTRPDSLSPDDVPLPSLPSSPRSSETPQPIQLYRLCTFQILIENQLVRRLAEKDYSAGIEGYWYQYFKRVCSMKEMIIHQKWYKMLFLMHKKMPKVMHMKHNRVCSTKEMIIHQKWY